MEVRWWIVHRSPIAFSSSFSFSYSYLGGTAVENEYENESEDERKVRLRDGLARGRCLWVRVFMTSHTHLPSSSRSFFAAALTGLVLSFAACNKQPEEAAKTPDAGSQVALESVDQRVSYGIGYQVGSNIARQGGFTADQAAMRAGLEDGLAGAPTRIPEPDLEAAFTSMQERAAATAAKAGETNLAAANAFLEKNRTRPGVKVTDSGLQYEVLKSGSGPKPKASDTVEVHYHGTLIDGTVFDSSVERGETISFPVTGVIPGWVEALQLMSVGDKWKLFIPPGLGYGPRATGKIPPNSALIFEVELIGIK